ncbi:MAG: sugar phosphotransferase [Ignavibacteriales bacterium]|nr:sugar phosphotransferase [Ignavibacteriales bacterium]
MLMQDGDFRTFPYGLHRSWRTLWHMWGNSQTQALALAGVALNDKRLFKSAEKEARSFYSRLLIEGFMKEMDVAKPGARTEYEQIAYGVRPMAVGLIRLYEATKKEEYLKMAGLTAAWLIGNNVLGERLYDPATGRCFDGIKDSVTVNKNSGAESTIEVLMTILEVERYPQAKKYLQYRKVKSGSRSRYLYAVFQNDADGELTLAIDLKQPRLLVLEGEKSRAFLKNVK